MIVFDSLNATEKMRLLRSWVGRHHVADLDVTVGHTDAVTQQLDELPFLRNRRLAQTVPHPAAEVLDATGHPRELLPAIDLHLQAPLLLSEPQGAALHACRRRRSSSSETTRAREASVRRSS